MELQGARLWLVRHGETDWNLAGRVQGHTPTDLNENGRRQAGEVAQFFRGRKIGSVWASDLPRAVTTAEIIAKGFNLPVRQAAGLRERSFGKFEGMTFPELFAARKELGLKQSGDLTDWNGMPGVETNQMLGERVMRVLKEILEGSGGQDAVVVTHGGVIARALYQVLEIGEDRPRRFPLANGMVAVLEWGKDAFYLLGLFDVGMVMGKELAADTSRVAGGSEMVHRIGCVSFLNSKPLIEPLVGRGDVEIKFAVPSKLMGMVEAGDVDAALLSVVDYQLCREELVLVPAGMIGCDGPTLTVRIFSRVPVGEIKVVHGDTDSHTSVILAQVILREGYGVRAELVPFEAYENEHRGGPETMLLIGDKVVNACPDEGEYRYQLDLGEEWKKLTGLPFLFAMWMMRREGASLELARILREGQALGAGMTELLVEKYAAERGWPAELARRYFTEYLRYAVTSAAREGLAKFFEVAGRLGLLEVKREPNYFETT